MYSAVYLRTKAARFREMATDTDKGSAAGLR